MTLRLDIIKITNVYYSTCFTTNDTQWVKMHYHWRCMALLSFLVDLSLLCHTVTYFIVKTCEPFFILPSPLCLQLLSKQSQILNKETDCEKSKRSSKMCHVSLHKLHFHNLTAEINTATHFGMLYRRVGSVYNFSAFRYPN